LPGPTGPTGIAPTQGVANALDYENATPVTVMEIFPRFLAAGTFALSSGQMRLTYWTPYKTMSISNVQIHVSAQGSGVTLARMGLYTVDGSNNLTLVAQTANDTTIGATSGAVSRALSTAGGYPASYTMTLGSRYALGAIVVGSNPPTVVTAASFGVSSIAPILAGAVSSQSDLASSISAGGVIAGSVMLWGRLY
jgi:hypothetical protein